MSNTASNVEFLDQLHLAVSIDFTRCSMSVAQLIGRRQTCAQMLLQSGTKGDVRKLCEEAFHECNRMIQKILGTSTPIPIEFSNEAIDNRYPVMFGMEVIPDNEFRREGAKKMRDLIYNK